MYTDRETAHIDYNLFIFQIVCSPMSSGMRDHRSFTQESKIPSLRLCWGVNTRNHSKYYISQVDDSTFQPQLHNTVFK